jgi:hypothetical protein
MKAGVAATRASYLQRDPTEENGYLAFSGQYTGNAVADFLLGMPATAIRVLDQGAGSGSLHPENFSGYVQDSLRVAEFFTLDLGARVDYLPPMVSRNGNLTSFWPQLGAVVTGAQRPLLQSSGVSFSPRLGFSWHPFGKNTLVRAGIGKFVGEDDLASTLGQLTGVQSPRAAVVSAPMPHNIDPFNPAWAPISNAVTRGIDPRNLVPAVYQYTVAVQRQLPGGLLAEASYVGSRGEHLGRLYNINQALPTGVLDASRLPVLLRPYPSLGDVLYEDHGAYSRYNAGRIAIRKPSGSRVTLNLVFTFAKSIDDASSVSERNWSTIVQAQDPRNLNLEQGLSDFDHRQQLTGFLTVRLDGFSRSAVLRRSTISVAASAMSGQPFTVLVNDDLRPDLVGNPYQSLPAGHYINPAAFVAHVPTPSRPDYFGDLGRNSLVGPYFNTINVAFNKGFRVKRVEIDLRVEVFNAADRVVPFISNYLGPRLGMDGSTINQGRLVIAGGRVAF